MEERSNFPHGSITKVVYTDFLTYDNVVLTPGSNLNLIIGTNGSGKSSVICGICLAVGGSPKSLGRSDKMGDYIKHGKDKSSVEVHIVDSKKGIMKFKIVISKPNCTEFFINDTKTPVRNVRELAVKYNIQIDNPCTFLAQDKVKSFSEQNAKELLINTERAGDVKLLEQHESLIEKKKEESDLDRRIKDMTVRLKNLRTERDNLIPIVENYKKRKAMESKLNALYKKIAIINYNNNQTEFKEEDTKLDQLRSEINKLSNKLSQLDIELNEAKRGREIAHKEVNNLMTKGLEMSRDLERVDNPRFYESLMKDADDRFEKVKHDAANYKTRLDELRNKISRLEETLISAEQALSGYEEFKVKHSNLTRQFTEQEDIIVEQDETIRNKKRQNRQKEYEIESSVSNFRKQLLERLEILTDLRMHGALNAWKWYEENERQFEHPVYLPVLHMTLNKENAKYFENAVGNRDLVMFIFGSKRDETLLTQGHQWRINTTVVPPNSVDFGMINATLPASLKSLGFQCWLSELYEAPDVVKQYISSVYRIHNIPIGNVDELSESTARDLYSNMRISVILTSVQRISIIMSKYSGSVIFSNSELRPPRVFLKHSSRLPPTEDISRHKIEVVRMRKAIEEEEDDLKRKQYELEERKKGLKQEIAEWKTKKDRVLQLRNQLQFENNDLQQKLLVKPNVAAAQEVLDQKRKEAFEQTMLYIDSIVEKTKMAAKIHDKHAFTSKKLQILEENVIEYDRKYRTMNCIHMNAKAELNQKEDYLVDLKQRALMAQENLQNKCHLSTLNVSSMNPQERKTWTDLERLFSKFNVPENIEELESAIAQEEAKKKMNTNPGTENDVRQLEKVTREHEELQQTFESQEKSKSNWNESFREAIMQWREPVEHLVKRINSNYRSFFSKLGNGCAGEVHLEIPQDELDIESYGIKIMVSFRSTEPLRRLDHQVQSGGERSVSTMLYLLSLQELCPVPFRCVDEINQGMDPTNERKVFDIMVDKLTGDGTLAKTQYFLLTPKLLRGLNYNDKVRIQIVHNGPFIPNNAWTWDVDSFMNILRSQGRREIGRA